MRDFAWQLCLGLDCPRSGIRQHECIRLLLWRYSATRLRRWHPSPTAWARQPCSTFCSACFRSLGWPLLWLLALLAALHRLINVALSGRRLKPDVRRAQPHGQAVYPRCAYLCTWFHVFAVPICTEPQTVFWPPAYRAVAIPWWLVALPLATPAPLARCCVLPHQRSRVLCGLKLLGAYSVLHRCAVGDAGLGLVVWTLPV